MNTLENGSPLVEGAELRVPTAVVNLPAKVMLAAARVDGKGGRSGRRPAVHVVRSGDSLWAIAESLAPDGDPRVLIDEIIRLNGLDDAVVEPGQRLALPIVP